MAVESKERKGRGVKGNGGRCHDKTMTDGLKSSDKMFTELEEKKTEV